MTMLTDDEQMTVFGMFRQFNSDEATLHAYGLVPIINLQQLNGTCRMKLLELMAGLSTAAERKVRECIQQWLPLRFVTGKIVGGAVGESLQGITFDSAEARQRIVEDMQSYISFVSIYEWNARTNNQGTRPLFVPVN